MVEIVIDHRKRFKEIRSHVYNHKIVRFNSRSGNNSLNQFTINKDPIEEKSNESTAYNQYWSTNDLLSYECDSNDNEKWLHSNETEYHRANLDDRLGVNFNSGIFDWSQSESWLIVQNAIINIILCKPNLDISEAVRNMRQLVNSGIETATIIEYCDKKVLRNTMRTLRRPLEKLNGNELISELIRIWKYYINYSYPIILLIFTTVSVPQKTIEYMLGTSFLNYILQRMKIEDIIKKQNNKINSHVRHMYYTIIVSVLPKRLNKLFHEYFSDGVLFPELVGDSNA
ncbi:unnamed protein product [Schistosoma margrebowiei]|uniref:Uncharacterized protein n=1 Tax=Schistosoma margrebowiei TaxID=48269 RepID=A0AA85AH05_9TREM|nr:unnamed protein product [Schistosoma margrebowiei]